MKATLTACCLGLLAVLATGAFAVINASATVNGHFVNDAANGHATIVATENYATTHTITFQRTEPTGTATGAAFACTQASYHGTVSAETVASITLTPAYNNCATTGGVWGELGITTNGCAYTFRSNSAASTHTPTAHATMTIACPVGKAIEVHHPNCTTTITAQTPKGGVTYTTTVENNKHAITMNFTISHLAVQFHGGICIFLGTSKEFDMAGAVTVTGQDTNGNPVNITAT